MGTERGEERGVRRGEVIYTERTDDSEGRISKGTIREFEREGGERRGETRGVIVRRGDRAKRGGTFLLRKFQKTLPCQSHVKAGFV